MNTDAAPVASDSAQGIKNLWWREMRESPWNFDFFYALRWIDAKNPDQPLLGTARRPSNEPVRLGQAPELSFAPSSLHRAIDEGDRPRIEVRFFGLFGPNGPLPLHLTEHARERLIHAGDPTFTSFADLFHHRLLLMFYRSWAQARPTVSMDRVSHDRFGQLVGALPGIGEKSLRNRDAAPDHMRLYFSGLFAKQVRNAEGLQKLISGAIGWPVTVEQFVGVWMPLIPSERTKIGKAPGAQPNVSAQLGMGAVLGSSVWDRQHNFRIHIGPLDVDGFDSLLPDGTFLPMLIALIEHYVGVEFGWDLRLTHRSECVRPSRPGKHGRLGWTSWLGTSRRRTHPHLTLSPGTAVRRAIRHHNQPS